MALLLEWQGQHQCIPIASNFLLHFNQHREKEFKGEYAQVVKAGQQLQQLRDW